MIALTQTVHIDDEGQLQDVLAANGIGAQGIQDDLKRMLDAGTGITVIVPGMPPRAIIRKSAIERLTGNLLGVVATLVYITVEREQIAHGWKLGPTTCALVAISVSLIAISAQGLAGQFPKINKKIDPLLSRFEWPEMLFLLTIAQALGDVFGAIQFSPPVSIGTIGGAGWVDGLVWVAPVITLLYAVARKYLRPDVNGATINLPEQLKQQ